MVRQEKHVLTFGIVVEKVSHRRHRIEIKYDKEQVDAFVSYLNRSCYTGITGYEFHFALFDKGSFYRKHLDQFQDNSSRQFSMITYLNENWQPEDGGELCIYDGNVTQKIAPTNRKTVFFKSNELVHEVLESHKPLIS